MHCFEWCQSTESIWEELECGTFFGTTLRSTQQPMRWISWTVSLCLLLPVDNKFYAGKTLWFTLNFAHKFAFMEHLVF